MYLKKFLIQPNIVGSVLIALLFGAGVIFAFGFDGFNMQTAKGGNTDIWLAMAGSGNCSEDGGTEDTPPESPPDPEPDPEPENPDPEPDPEEEENEDPPNNPAVAPANEDPPPCDCDTTTDKLHSCGCNNKNWGEIMKTKNVNGTKKKVGTGEYGWLKPCDNVKVPYPCPKSCDRKAHIGDKKWDNHCPCPDHPRYSDSTTGPWDQNCRKNWTVCTNNNKPTHCTKGKCKNKKKK